MRSSARYECPFFGSDGKLRRKRVTTTELGTAFAYEVAGNETYLLTNEHVAVFPEVTDGLHRVDGVPEGCKRVEDKLRIVRDERDDFEAGQIPLVRVAVDPLLDAAILKAPQALNVIPYRFGKSASLRQGNAIRARGFPLGVMQAVSDGKIVNPYDRDQEQGWDHVDFVVDALLSEGNSGSPVLAVSCATRDLQLVGMYHAGYKGHSALNTVVGIDQLVEFMRRKKRIPRAVTSDAGGLVAKDRARLVAALDKSTLPLFEFGGITMRVDDREDALIYHLYGRQFPLDDHPVLVIEDLPKDGASGTFGEVGRLFVPASPPAGTSAATGSGATGAAAAAASANWRSWPLSALGNDERDLVLRATQAIRLQVLRTLDFRRANGSLTSQDDRRRARDLMRTISRDAVLARELAGALLDMTERLAVGPDAPATSSPVSEAPPPPSTIPAPPLPPSARP